MYLFLTILIVLASVLLVLLVLVQNSKGGGLAAGFASSNQVLGVRKTTDFLEKATWLLVGFVVVVAIVSGAFIHSGSSSSDPVIEGVQQTQQAIPGATAPNFGEQPEQPAE